MTAISLFTPIDEDEADPIYRSFNQLKRALARAQEIGLHTHEAQAAVERAFEDLLLHQTAAAYHRGYRTGKRDGWLEARP